MLDLKKILKDIRNIKTLLKSSFMTLEVKNYLRKSENYIIDLSENEDGDDKPDKVVENSIPDIQILSKINSVIVNRIKLQKNYALSNRNKKKLTKDECAMCIQRYYREKNKSNKYVNNPLTVEQLNPGNSLTSKFKSAVHSTVL
jgi:hypothetical protein